jgi:hypothetical protein
LALTRSIRAGEIFADTRRRAHLSAAEFSRARTPETVGLRYRGAS